MNRTTVLTRISIILLVIVLIPCSMAAAAVDSQAPTAPKALEVTGKTPTSISLSWSESRDNVKVKGYQIFRDGKKSGTTSNTAYTSSNLIPGVQYEFLVRAFDTAGNISEGSMTIKASTTSDTEAPTAPRELKAADPGYTSVTLSWKQSADNVGIKGYDIYCNDKMAGSTTNTVYEYKKLTPGMSYTFHVKARDKAGNCSAQSNTVIVTALADKIAPAAPAGLKAATVSVSEVSLTWSPASDNAAVKGYDIIQNGIKIGTSTRTSYTSKGLFPARTYTYTVRAFDISGNQSSSSLPLEITTAEDSQAPSAPSALKAASVKGCSVTLSWTAAKDNGKVAGYQIYCNDIVVATTVSASKVLKIPFGPGQFKLWVKAFDQSGNLSGSSNTITVATTIE